MLNSVCALAIELKDKDRIPALLAKLLAHPQAPLAMFFFELGQVRATQGQDAARFMLEAAIRDCPRLINDPEFSKYSGLLGPTS